MADINVFLISSVRPEPTSAGSIVLHRHLIGQPGISLEVYGCEEGKLTPSFAVRRVFGRMQRTCFHRFAEDFWALWEGRWLDRRLPCRIEQRGRSVVLTVAHGDLYMAASRFARKHKLPLITFFHDWWPDIPDIHASFRPRLARNFRKLYHGSTVALCVSEGMKDALGNHSNAPVLYPISDRSGSCGAIPLFTQRDARLLKVYYSGNLYEYGAMLGEALGLLKGHETIRLEVRGANPHWPRDFRESMRAQSLWKDFAPRNELSAWLAEADVFLIPMSFEVSLRQRMETSFPSKLIEFAQLGKPLVIWGPEYCSAVKWARKRRGALCITDPNPVALCEGLEILAASPDELQRLAAATRHAAQTEFNPKSIHQQFNDVLHKASHS